MNIKHLHKSILAAALLSGISAHAQNNVGIGTTTPHPSARLEITTPAGATLGQDLGLLIPRMGFAQRQAIVTPAQGLLVFQNDVLDATHPVGFYYFDGSAWAYLNPIGTPGAAGPAGPAGNPDNLGDALARSNVNMAGYALQGTGATLAVGTVGLGVRGDGGLNLGQNTVGNNVSVGYLAGQATPSAGAGFNTYVGYQSGAGAATAPQNNVFLGYKSGLANTGSNNTFLGVSAGAVNTGTSNVFLGYQSGVVNAAGTNNQFFGYQSGLANTSGNNNAFFGYRSGKGNTSGSDNLFFGHQSGLVSTQGGRNIAIGVRSGNAMTTASQNQFIGYESGLVATAIGNTNNQFTGYQTGWTNTTGTQNYFSGFQSGYLNKTGSNNHFNGYQSGYNNNVVGAAGTGNNNHFDGYDSGYNNTTGNNNQFSGYSSGGGNTTGDNNLFIGYQAGNNLAASGGSAVTSVSNVTGSNNTFVGYQAGPTVDGLTNAMALGYQAKVSASNTLAIGGPAGSGTQLRVGIGVTSPSGTYVLETAGDINAIGKVYATGIQLSSDRRFKQDIQSLAGALSQVQRLRGVSYTFRQKDFPARNLPAGNQIGVIAQELEQVLPELVSTGPDGYKAVNYAQLTPVLIEAIKELAAQNATLRQQVAMQQGRDAGQTAEIRTMQQQLARLLGEESGSASAKQ